MKNKETGEAKFVRVDANVMERIKDLANIKERTIQEQINIMLREHPEYLICEGKFD